MLEIVRAAKLTLSNKKESDQIHRKASLEQNIIQQLNIVVGLIHNYWFFVTAYSLLSSIFDDQALIYLCVSLI